VRALLTSASADSPLRSFSKGSFAPVYVPPTDLCLPLKGKFWPNIVFHRFKFAIMDIDTPQDPDSVAAQSLRAAALLSRKRRKVAIEQTPGLPQRPPVEQTMQLDYGQEENFTPPANSFATQNKVPSASEEPPPDPTPEIEDGQIREEGEISDTEESAPLPAPRPTSPPPKFRRLETSSKDSRPSPTSPVIDSNPPPLSATRLDSPFAPSKTASDSESFHHPSPTFSRPFVLETSSYRLDADHVRPELASSC
jgi:hypothetical protein